MTENKELQSLKLDEFQFKDNQQSSSSIFVESFSPIVENKSFPKHKLHLNLNDLPILNHLSPSDISDGAKQTVANIQNVAQNSEIFHEASKMLKDEKIQNVVRNEATIQTTIFTLTSLANGGPKATFKKAQANFDDIVDYVDAASSIATSHEEASRITIQRITQCLIQVGGTASSITIAACIDSDTVTGHPEWNLGVNTLIVLAGSETIQSSSASCSTFGEIGRKELQNNEKNFSVGWWEKLKECLGIDLDIKLGEDYNLDRIPTARIKNTLPYKKYIEEKAQEDQNMDESGSQESAYNKDNSLGTKDDDSSVFETSESSDELLQCPAKQETISDKKSFLGFSFGGKNDFCEMTDYPSIYVGSEMEDSQCSGEDGECEHPMDDDESSNWLSWLTGWFNF